MSKKLAELVRKTNQGLAHTETKNLFRLLAKVLQSASLKVPVHKERYDKLQGLLRNRKVREFYEEACAVDPTMYEDSHSFFVAAQVAALVKKYPWPRSLLDLDPEEAAYAAVLKAEHKCKRMNQWFRAKRKCFYANEDFFEKMRAFISYVLGPLDREACFRQCDFGSGASVGVHGKLTHVGRKIDASEWTCTPAALPFLYAAMAQNHHAFPWEYREYGEDHRRVYCIGQTAKQLKKVSKNKNEFVPKTAATHRSIRTEPLANGFLQKGVDRYIRQRLLRIGLDLSDQRRNAAYARYGSEDWQKEDGFCTIDLSSASDSISIELVREVLPPEWFSFLNCLRSPSGDFGERGEMRYQGFVTMGNGFCFPLETLIFAAVCHASGCGRPRLDYVVYGDDIVVRRGHFREVLKNLSLCGFTPNKKKTFGEGPFRESCGADFWAGKDVRPFTLDFALNSVQNVFKFLNLCRRNDATSSFFMEVWDFVLSLLPEDLHLYRPFKSEQSESAIDPWVEPLAYSTSCSTWRWEKRIQNWTWVELGTIPCYDEGLYSEEARCYAILRGSEDRFTFRRMTRTRIRRIPDVRYIEKMYRHTVG